MTVRFHRIAGALEGLARAPDPHRQRACCELAELLSADQSGLAADLTASLQEAPADDPTAIAASAAVQDSAAARCRCGAFCFMATDTPCPSATRRRLVLS